METVNKGGEWSDARAQDVRDPLARCARCGARAIEHDFRDRTHHCASTLLVFVSEEMARGCCGSDMSQPHEPGCPLHPEPSEGER